MLVLSNSLGATHEMWDRQLPALVERFRVLRYDSRGHGRSPVPPGPYEMADLGGDVVELLDRLEVEQLDDVAAEVGHLVGARGHRRAAVPARVIAHNAEALDEGGELAVPHLVGRAE